ncbi:MAG: tetratricopeptide repeat protein [Candidatus Omnitrophica bacterium]|nr:tetratricopeptide repeat protein [Candidatus Omnitrophota bacterium]
MRVVCLFLGLSLLMPSSLWAASTGRSVREGNRLYSQGNFEDAARHYEKALEKNPESALVNFNAGTALYKQKRYPQAAQYLQKALLSDDPRLKEKAYYNLGNTLYQSGIGHQTKDIGAAVQGLQESLSHFENALRLDKTDKDAQDNYEFVKKELERLKQEQKQQSSQGQKEKQDRDSQSKEGQQNQAKGSQESPGQQAAAEKKENSEDKQSAAPETSSENKKESGEQQSMAAGSQQESGQPAEEQKEQAASAAVDNSKDLTKEEAERILQSYQQSEEPRGLLKVFQNKGGSSPVLKDW